jgi:hypothetical protein
MAAGFAKKNAQNHGIEKANIILFYFQHFSFLCTTYKNIDLNLVVHTRYVNVVIYLFSYILETKRNVFELGKQVGKFSF